MISSSHFDDVFRLSAMMNAAHRRQVPPWETVCWFRLFKKVDTDGSGLISYDEFLEMVRKDLKLSALDWPTVDWPTAADAAIFATITHKFGAASRSPTA